MRVAKVWVLGMRGLLPARWLDINQCGAHLITITTSSDENTYYHTDRDFSNTNQGGKRREKMAIRILVRRVFTFLGQCVFFALEERRQKNWYDEKRIKFLHLLTVRVEGGETPPLYGQPDRNIFVLFTPCLILSWLPELRDEVEDIVGDQTNLIWWKILCAFVVWHYLLSHTMSACRSCRNIKREAIWHFEYQYFSIMIALLVLQNWQDRFLLAQTPHRPTESFR